MKALVIARGMALAIVVCLAVSARAETVVLPKDTPVILVFDQPLRSKTAKVGDPVGFHVRDAVSVGNRTVLPAGAAVTGVVSKVDHPKRYGVNAKMRIALNPVQTEYGLLTLEPRSEGKLVGGGKTDKAAAATAGGAIVAGPIGLAGGYFIRGKSVEIRPGDAFPTEVARDTTLNVPA